MNYTSTTGWSLTTRLSAIITVISLILSAFPASFLLAASTGITINKSVATVAVDEEAHFKVSTVLTDGGVTPDTDFSVSDGGLGGVFYNGNFNDETCSKVDADGVFPIENNKAFCYSNSTSGVYDLTVQLLDVNGASIGSPVIVTVTVEESTGSGGGGAGSGAVWTNTGPCGSPQNVNQYGVGEDFYGHGSNFSPNTSYPWVVKDPGTNGAVLESGTIMTDANGDFCELLFTIDQSHVGGPYQFNVGDAKNDNFKVVQENVPTLSADLSITKSVSTTSPNEGSAITYTLTVTNLGPDDAAGVVVTDPLVSDLIFVSSTPTPNSIDPYTWLLADLPSGASTTISVTTTVKSGTGVTIIANTATVIGSLNDPDLSNNSDTVRVNKVVPPEVIPGCTDTDAFNYNQLANVDNGSCTYVVTVNKVINGKTEYTPNMFSLTVDGTATTSFNASGTANVVLASGTYAIVEVPVAGFISSSLDCGTLTVVDAPVSCTITNTPEEQVEYGTFVVVKEVVGEDEPTYSDFSFTVNGTATTSFTSGNTVELTLVTGIYSVIEAPVEGYSTSYANCDEVTVTANATTTCTITNTKQTAPQCVPGLDVWAETVESYNPGLTKGGVAVAASRSNPDLALGEADWLSGGSAGFVSLGFGGTIVVSYADYIVDGVGDDIFVHEATNGVYPAETALVEVSQNGSDWYPVGVAARGVTSFDLATTSLLWINQIRLTDTTDAQLHNDEADGFDLDAIMAAERACEEPVLEVDTYKIEGYVWHDDNRNTEWDGRSELNDDAIVDVESPLADWVVTITNGSTTLSTSTDELGYYYFEVPAGTWTITETVQDGWERTTVESHTVTVPEVTAQASWSFWEWLLPTAHAALLGTYGEYNFGNDTIDNSTPTQTSSRGGGGSSGTRVRPTPTVAGDNTSLVNPTPLILGEQVSVVPVGAPNTGRGGAAPTSVPNGAPFTTVGTWLALPRRFSESD